LDYVGQTGSGTMTLRKRVAGLKAIYGSEMPYRDPHAAGPALWALRQNGGEFEVSTATVQVTTPWRKGLEAVEISRHRLEYRRSPTVNFGRMPPGYRMSSGNNAQLAEAGKRHRGGPTAEQDESHVQGLPPLGPLVGDPESLDWCGHKWSEWCPVANLARTVGAAEGLYRIRDRTRRGLVYIGQGAVSSRLRAHIAKATEPGHRQAAFFASPTLECSVVLDSSWHAFQRLEFENDLIAAHILETGELPTAQFLG